MKALDALFKADSTALSLRQKRMEILGSNIANAATPHFKARDIDFEAAYKSAMNTGEITKTSSAHIDVGGTADTAEVRYRVPLSPSLDGNTVELHVEQVQFAENATHYEATLNFLNGRISTMRKALRGE